MLFCIIFNYGYPYSNKNFEEDRDIFYAGGITFYPSHSPICLQISKHIRDYGSLSSFWVFLLFVLDTVKTQYRKFEKNIPRKGILWPQSQFPRSCVCEQFIYSHDRPSYSAAGKYEDRSWEYINRSHTHECGNWDWSRAVPFLGKHEWDFHCSAGRMSL